jgi:hypothetical protein
VSLNAREEVTTLQTRVLTKPGFHRTIWADPAVTNAPFMAEYFHNSMEKDSEEMEQIKAACRDAGVFVVLGYSERHNGTLYIAQVSWHVHSSCPVELLSSSPPC